MGGQNSKEVSEMKSFVVYFPSVTSRDTVELSQLCPADVKIPEGFSLSGGRRKFIILKDKDELVLAIGPLMAGNPYYHKSILDVSVFQYGHLAIAGGGMVDFKAHVVKGQVKWAAKFSGASGDFGVFDPGVLVPSVRKVVEESLGMDVSFEWSF
jgi:hypothetical protein